MKTAKSNDTVLFVQKSSAYLFKYTRKPAKMASFSRGREALAELL